MLEKLNVLSKEAIVLLKKNNLLNELIKKELINFKLKNINLNEEEILTVKNIFMKKNNINNDDELIRFLDKNQLDKETYLDDLTFSLKLRNYSVENFKFKVNSHFLSRKKDLDTVIYSLIRVDTIYKANELYLRLKSKESSFASIATEFSLGPENKTKGIVGPISFSQSNPLVSDKLKELKEKEFSKPFQVADLWAIVQLETFSEAKLTEEMEQYMANELCDLWLAEESTILEKELLNKFSEVY